MYRRKPIFILSVCAVLVLIGLVASAYFNPVSRNLRRLHQRQMDLGRSADLGEIASGCKLLIQSRSAFKDQPLTGSDSRLPPSIRSKGARWVSVDAGSVVIEFGGGFFHYGYRFERVEAGTGKWRLMLYGEEPEDVKELLRL